VSKRLFHVFVEENLQVLLAFSIKLLLLGNPRLNIGSPLITISIRNVKNTSTRYSGGCSELQVTNFENKTHVRLNHNTLVRGKGKQLVIIHDRVHRFNPVSIKITIKNNPLGVGVLKLGKGTHSLRHKTINPLTSSHVYNTVQLISRDDLGVHVNNSSFLAIGILSLGKSLPGARLASGRRAHSEHAMTNDEQFGKLDDLEHEALIIMKTLVSNNLLDNVFKAHVTSTRNVNTGEKISE
jgi:hypothetical protein